MAAIPLTRTDGRRRAGGFARMGIARARRAYRRGTLVLQVTAAAVLLGLYAAAVLGGRLLGVALVGLLCVAAVVALPAAGPGRRDR